MREQHREQDPLRPLQRPKQTTLASLGLGIDAIVVDILNTPDNLRCAEVGFYRGAHVKKLSQGDPCLVSLNDARMAVSKRVLEHVVVSYIE